MLTVEAYEALLWSELKRFFPDREDGNKIKNAMHRVKEKYSLEHKQSEDKKESN